MLRWVAVPLVGVLLPWIGFLVADAVSPFPWAALERPLSVEVTGRDGEPLRRFLAADERWRFPVRLDDLPPELPAAVVAAEDRRFYSHWGVDPVAIARAAWSNLSAGRVVSGASTLPMQIARLAHRFEAGEARSRTLGAKLVEAFRALQLDWHRSKDEILEIYLNLAPYGRNLEGVGAASRFWFDTTPDGLSAGEIALLVALPRSPVGYDPVRRSQAARSVRDRVLDELTAKGVFDPERASRAKAQPLPKELAAVPFVAPHLTRLASRSLRPLGGTSGVRTTVDRRLQQVVTEQVSRRIGELRDRGLGNAAAVVLDLETRAVRAWVGSAEFFDETFQGQVDGILARRSPGSTLKPFLYALAFDRGDAVPESWLLDVPRDYAGYTPENYDGTYRGRVTAREALIHSLNAPAVALLADVGLEPFHGLLRDGGLDTLAKDPGRYGLPLILGGGEVDLVSLTNLYATLADGGRNRPWTLWFDQERAPRRSDPELLSRGASSLVLDVLTQVERPDLPESWNLARGVPRVAWKTGTSFGHRDAWAVGVSRRWAIGVWVGRFDGRAVQGISGSRDAGPLLFDLFRAVETGGASPPEPSSEPPEIEVCEVSRDLPGPWCPTRLHVPYLPGRSHFVTCRAHRRILVDAETGDRLPGDCGRGRVRTARVVTLHPPELVGWWRSRDRHVEGLPPVAAGCSGRGGGDPPRIVSPDAATPYRVRPDAPRAYQKVPLVARAGASTERLYWYQDGRLLVTASPDRDAFLPLPEPGVHRLVVVDDMGRSDAVEYRVE